MSNLPAGVYKVKVDFDGGGSAEMEVSLQVGHIERVTLPLPELRRFKRHQGWYLSGGPFFGVSGENGLGGLQAVGGYYIATSAWVELRLSAGLGFLLGGVSGPELFLLPSLRVNVTTVYSMEFGFQFGGSTVTEYPNGTEFRGIAGLRASFVTLRLGPQRQIELSLWHALGYLPDAEAVQFQTGVALGYVFL
jgi:hypothetical protein